MPLLDADLSSPELCLALIRSSPDCLEILSPDGDLDLVNEAALAALGAANTSQVVGAVWADLWVDAHRQVVTRAIGEASQGDVARFQAERGSADGALKWWDVSLTQIRGSAGRPQRMLAVLRDIDEAKKTEAELRRKKQEYRQISDNTSDVIIRADLKGNVLFVSAGVRRYGYEPEELIGTNPINLFHPDDRPRFRTNTKNLLVDIAVGRQVEREHRFRRKNGGWVWLEGNPSLVRDALGAPVEFINVFRDVTERRIAADQTREIMRRNDMAEEVAGVGHWSLDVRTGTIIWSKQMFKVFGLDFTDSIQLAPAMAMIHPDDQVASNNRLDHARRTGEGWSDDLTRVIRPCGEVRYVAGRATCERGRDGSVVTIIGTMIDITEQKRAEAELAKSEARYRLIAETATDMISESGLDATIRLVTPACRAILGFEPSELIGRTTLSLSHPDDVTWIVPLYSALVAEGPGAAPRTVQFRGQHKDGHWVWLEGCPKVIFDPTTGRPEGFHDVVRDISARKEAETALVAAKREAERASEVKAEFLANMSHEIRTPLTALLGFSNLLAESPDLAPPERDHVSRITRAGKGLLALVNDVLDFSKLEAGLVEIHPRVVDLAEITGDALAMFAPQASAKSLELRSELEGVMPDHFLLDPDRLRQILLNLLGNAIKFSDVGTVTLTTSYDLDAQQLSFAVSDCGPGMDEVQRGKLFQRFSQVDGSSTRRHGGTGLGLAICKSLSEAMGGSIDVVSEPGHGSTFRFRVNARPAVRGGANAGEAPVAAIDGIRVLVVDDNVSNRDLVGALLKSLGADVTEAIGGADGVRRAKEQPFDIILMDIRMPEVDGPQALARIRAEPGPNSDVPILAFSAEAEAERYCVARGGDFDGIIRKPINAADLVGVVSGVLAGDAVGSEFRGVADVAA